MVALSRTLVEAMTAEQRLRATVGRLASLMHASATLKKHFRTTDQQPSLFARFFPVLRQLNGIVAGALGMSWWRFLLFNAIGAALWVGAWVFIAIYFSAHTADAPAQLDQIRQWIDAFAKIIAQPLNE